MLPRVPELTRRAALLVPVLTGLLGGAAAGLSGCSPRRHPPVPTPRETLLDDTLALEVSLVASYDAALRVLPLTARVRPLVAAVRAAHLEHRAALLTAGAQPLPPQPTPAPAPVIPLTTAAATLAATETAAATLRTAACLRGPRDLAPLLASLAASETAHAALLRAVR
jgi:hypothetical protein